jgi:hypothetical protein
VLTHIRKNFNRISKILGTFQTSPPPEYSQVGKRSPSRYKSVFLTVSGLVLTAVALLASSGTISVISTNRVSNEAWSGYRWEPSAAVGSATWTHAWASYTLSTLVGSLVSSWNGSSWNSPTQLTPPTGLRTGDVNLAWDSLRNRFVFAALDLPATGNHSIWYGYSSDAFGTSWTFTSTPVFSAAAGDWDYPSIGVDGAGRVIIGGVKFPGPSGYYSAVSSDGMTFSAPSFITSSGAQSRVVATDTLFQAFVPTLNGSSLPIAVNRYQSSDGVTWSGPFSIATFSAPLNNSPSAPTIFYAPLLAAQGYPNGLSTVAFQINNGGYNNVYICTSDRGCGIVNPAADDQFLVGNSVSADRGYWIGYLTYSTLVSRGLPLITQAIYFPTGLPPIGATTNTGIDPTSWLPVSRCSATCFGAGDFNTVASNPFASATTPFVEQTARQNDLFQSFVQDPPASNVPNFTPKFEPYPVGSDLTNLGLAVPAQSVALSPELTRGIPEVVQSRP